MNAEDYIRSDTEFVLNYEYSREILQHGLTWSDSPIFDSLAADRFASDRYNLGDYR